MTPEDKKHMEDDADKYGDSFECIENQVMTPFHFTAGYAACHERMRGEIERLEFLRKTDGVLEDAWERKSNGLEKETHRLTELLKECEGVLEGVRDEFSMQIIESMLKKIRGES